MTDSKLIDAISEANARLQEQGVNVQGGKKYLMVKDRVIIFRHYYGDQYGIETSMIQADDERVVVHAKVTNANGLTIGSGLGEEQRDSRGVNSTSALENAETSAIGRALASLGLHGGEYASADEMAQAMQAQEKPKRVENTPTAEVFDSDWKNTIVPNTKHKGKKLGELAQGSLKWFIENWQPWRGSDGDREPSQEHIDFRSAIDSANKALFSNGSEIQPTDEISGQTAGDPTDPDLDEEVPF
jgi:hypothetical protein